VGRSQVAQFARDSYMQGSTAPGTRALMTSGGPSELLERAALLDAAGAHRSDQVTAFTAARQEADAADAAAVAAALGLERP
jgi:hypothetical protein